MHIPGVESAFRTQMREFIIRAERKILYNIPRYFMTD